MLHEPAKPQGPDDNIAFKSRLGVKMFAAYAVIYALFVAINVIDVTWMERTVLFGLNLAVVFGFGLIVLALVLALIYNRACNRQERATAAGKSR